MNAQATPASGPVLVAGATGSLGSRIVHGLLARGERVRALCRPASDTTALAAAGAEIATGDLRDPESLARACRGCSSVISTASATRRTDDTLENVDLNGNLALVAAAQAEGVAHFTFISVTGASEDSPVPLFRMKAEVERSIRASGMDATILQPTGFMDPWFGMLIEMPVFTGQPVTLVGESRRRHSFIAEQDVAEYALRGRLNAETLNGTFQVGGAEAVSFRDVVDAYAAALARPIEVRSIAPGESIPGLPPQVADLAASLETYDTIVPVEENARRFGFTPMGPRAFAAARVAEAAKRPPLDA